MTNPSDQPQYQSQPQNYSPPPPAPPAAPSAPPAQPQPQGSYPPPAYQQTGPQPYAPYAPQPRQSTSLAGGVWGILLLAVGGALTAIGLIALIVALIVDYPQKSAVVYDAFLLPGLLLSGTFLALQAWATVAGKDK